MPNDHLEDFEQFDRAWQAFYLASGEGPEPAVKDFLASDSTGDRRVAALMSLIDIDQQHRWDPQSHLPIPVERREVASYLAEWPELRSPEVILKLILGELEYRAEIGQLTGPEILRRWGVLVGADIEGPKSEELPEPPPDAPSLPLHHVIRNLGRGGQGSVWLARRIDGENEAVKVIDGVNPVSLGRFAQEIKALERLQENGGDPGIVRILSREFKQPPFHLAMEYCPEGSLKELFDNRENSPLDSRESAKLVKFVALSLVAPHEGRFSGGRSAPNGDSVAQSSQSSWTPIIHRDIKPANILLSIAVGEDFPLLDDRLDARYQPKLADFGNAKLRDEDSGPTLSGTVLGTPSYMPPEQARGEGKDAGPAADIYSIGAVFYECLTGRPPFKGINPRQIIQQVLDDEPLNPRLLAPAVPRDLAVICLKCLQKDPAKRYSSARELAADLTRHLKGEPILARPTPSHEKAWKWCRRRPTRAISIGAAVILATVLGTVTVRELQRRQANERTLSSRIAVVRTGLGEAVDLQRRDDLVGARRILQGVGGRVAEGVPPEVLSRVDEVRRDQDMAERLDRIHQQTYAVAPGSELKFVGVGPEYAKACGDFGLDLVNSAKTADRIRKSPISQQLISALSFWSNFAQGDEKRRILETIRAASTNEWERKFHDPKARANFAAMIPLLATDIPVEQLKPTQIEGLAAAFLYSDQIIARFFGNADRVVQDTESLLRRGVQHHRSDSGLNLMLGMHLVGRAHRLQDDAKKVMLEEGLGYFRAAVAARPEIAVAHNALALGLLEARRPAEAEISAREALRLSPDLAVAKFMLAAALQLQNKPSEAEQVLKVGFDPTSGDFQWSALLGMALFQQRKLDEAARILRLALDQANKTNQVFARPPDRIRAVGGIYMTLGRIYEDRGDVVGTQELFRECVRLYPEVAEPWARLSLNLVHFGELDEAENAAQQAIRRQPSRLAHEALAMVRVHRGAFAEAAESRRAAMTMPSADGKKASFTEQMKANTVMSTMLTIERDTLPAYQSGKARPSWNSERLLAAELWLCKGKPLASVRYYEEAFRNDSNIGATLSPTFAPLTYFDAAAMAAAQVAVGRADAAETSGQERAAWRQKSLRWLRLDLDRIRKAIETPSHRGAALSVLQIGKHHPDLAVLRDDLALQKLPDKQEQDDCRRFWKEVETLISDLLHR